MRQRWLCRKRHINVEPLIVAKLDVTTVQRDDGMRDSHAEPRSSIRRRVKRLEDAREVFVGDTGSGIGDGDPDGCPVGLHANLNLASAPCGSRGVVDNV